MFLRICTAVFLSVWVTFALLGSNALGKNDVRVTSPANLVAELNSDQVLTVLPTGAIVNVIGEYDDWIRISVHAGNRVFEGYLEKSKTTWQPEKGSVSNECSNDSK